MNKRQLGGLYERQAEAYLCSLGYEIVERNFRCRQGEIDLIGREGAYLCFIEVKYRQNSCLGDPLEAVDFRKQRKMILTAQVYLTAHPRDQSGSCRFDVVGIMPGQIRLIRNAFTC